MKMKPVVREYFNDEKLIEDVNHFIESGVDKENIYIMSHDEDRTERVANNADANTVGMKELGISDMVGTMFTKKGDELRTKMEEIGLSETEAEYFEEQLDKGKILMMVKN